MDRITLAAWWPMFLPNVLRQQSLAGGAGGSQGLGAKGLGLLFSSQVLCLSAWPRWTSLESEAGQRLAARACSRGVLEASAALRLRYTLYCSVILIFSDDGKVDLSPSATFA